jgi:hypothetical protein
MVAAIIFVVSMAAFAQFWLYYWRASISGVAANEISDRIRVAAGITHAGVGPQDFRNILILKDVSPDLRGAKGSFAAIHIYYSVMERLGSIAPMMASWANAEMTICARYAAVVMDRYMERNMACAAQVRGM